LEVVVVTSATTKQILLGRIAGVHGIRGEVVIHAYTGTPEDITAYGPLSDENGTRTFTVQIVRVTAKGA
jgi:16S rRNA processing protein RimM